MKHPWTDTPVCYQCYTKKPGKYDWVKCRSDKKMDHLCPPLPVDSNGNPLTTSTTITATAITETSTVAATSPGIKWETTTVTLAATTALPTPEGTLAARSWHKDVTFRLPWADNRRMCADAEWEKRGQGDKEEIRLQEVHAEDGNDCNGAEVVVLDLPDPIVETITTTVGATATETLAGVTAVSTTTVFIFTSHVTTVAASTHTPGTTSELQPIIVEITKPITIETEVPTVVTMTTTSTILPEAAQARAEAPPHRDL